MNEKVKVLVKKPDGSTSEFYCEKGRNLRQELLNNGLNPYVNLTSKLNCRGNGICATCGVFIKEDPSPNHWHDKLAWMFAYPRLSCQITIENDMHVEIPSKIIWGKRRK